MRKGFLYAIWSLVLTSIVLGSCIKGDHVNTEYSSDASVRAFSIDTVYGKKYKFNIDLLNNSIYNPDSLPYLSDTLLKSFLIDTFTVTGYVTLGDTLFRTTDSLDLTLAMNGKDGIMFTVVAADGQTSRNYRLNVRVHMVDPDSLTWSLRTDVPEGFAQADFSDGQKVVAFNNELLIYHFTTAGDAEVYHTSLSNPLAYTWQTTATDGLPKDVLLHSILKFNGKLYALTEGGEVYLSEDGKAWSQDAALSGNVKTLLAGMSDKLLGIVTVDGADYFSYTDAEGSAWNIGKVVPADFPTEHIYSSVITSRTGVERADIVGMPVADEEKTTPWFTFEGNEWAALATDDLYCPALENPTIFNYNSRYYMFGSALDSIYSSISGLTWETKTSKFMLPAELNGSTDFYTMTVDASNYIWIVATEKGNNQIWRGRLNKLSK